MNALLKFYFAFGAMVNLVMAFVIAVGSRSSWWTWLGTAMLIVVVAQLFFQLFMLMWVGNKIEKNWGKTIEQLELERAEVKRQWDHVNTVSNVIGEHEAIKLWKAEKEKRKNNDAITKP